MDFFLQLKSVSLRLWRRRHPSAQLLLSLKRSGFGKPSWRILPAPLGATRAAHVRTHLLELLSLCLLIGKPIAALTNRHDGLWVTGHPEGWSSWCASCDQAWNCVEKVASKDSSSGSNYIKLARNPLQPRLKQMLKDGEMSFLLGNIWPLGVSDRKPSSGTPPAINCTICCASIIIQIKQWLASSSFICDGCPAPRTI